jgi:hypothetical protein
MASRAPDAAAKDSGVRLCDNESATRKISLDSMGCANRFFKRQSGRRKKRDELKQKRNK